MLLADGDCCICGPVICFCMCCLVLFALSYTKCISLGRIDALDPIVVCSIMLKVFTYRPEKRPTAELGNGIASRSLMKQARSCTRPNR